MNDEQDLHDYIGRVVAMLDGHIIHDTADFTEMVAWLRANNLKADTTFRVPDGLERICLD